MHKVSIVGIDNTGKTSIVKSLEDVDGIATINVTTFQNNASKIAGISGKLVNGLAQFGEQHDSKFLTGAAYFMHLFPYFFEQRAKKYSPLLVSDRDPIVDTLCYSDFYLPDGYSRIIRLPLQFLLEHSFDYPNSFIYLLASPEVSASRYKERNQLHETIKALSRLRELFDGEMLRLEKNGIKIIRIDTDTKPLEEVANEVKFHLKNTTY